MKVILLTALVGLSACVTIKPEPVPVYNAMPALWAGTRTNINKLEARQAPKIDWDKSAAEKYQIMSVSKLLEMVPQPLSKLEADEISDQFRKSALTVHYGFDCDYHALVFFDANMKTRKVIKW